MTKNNVIQDPGTGGTFVQNGMAYGTATVGAGTYKLPDGGLPQYVQASGAVTITSVAGVTVAILASGQTALCVPLSSTTWAARPWRRHSVHVCAPAPWKACPRALTASV